MIDVLTTGSDSHFRALAGAGARLQQRFRFTQATGEANYYAGRPYLDCSNHPQLCLAESRSYAPFYVCKDRGAVVSTWAMDGLCRYAGVEAGAYMLLCSLLGLTQWRALQLNPLLEEYDFLHRTDGACLYRAIGQPEDFALLLDEPRLCGNCAAFYNCLGVEPEIEALDAIIGHMRSTTSPQPASQSV